MKLKLAALFLICTSFAAAEIKEIDRISSILPDIEEETLVLLDIDETLIETPIMLGGKAWRRYARNILNKSKGEEEATRIHDKLTYFIAGQVPYIAIEDEVYGCFTEFKTKNASVFGFTARGREHWYDMPSPDGEALGVLHLKQAGIELYPSSVIADEALFLHPSYGQNIFFAYPLEDKGDLILELFAGTSYRPSKVVFVDDKLDHARSVDSALKSLGIPAVCFHYTHVDSYRPFDAMIAHIQLEKLLFENRTLSNDEAAALKSKYADKNPDEFFLELINRFLSN
ncbi:MAG: DUF2608 domain-containing protein [Chlamydiales bacterium]|nr:DUF2608 domain-containing protein [Chlamydiales bacterium]